MNQDQQPRPWWKNTRLVWALAVLVLTWLLTTTILFLFPLTTILFLFPWRSWDWRWLVLLGLTFLSAGVLYLTVRGVWNRLFDLTGLRGKTLWDFIGLLIVPLVIALAGWWLSEISTRNQREIEDRRAQAQQQIEDDRVRQSVLQSYIQDMTELLLDKGLATSEPDEPIREIARSSTLAVVRQLDGERKGILLEFLFESNLVIRSSIDPIISMSGADLSGAILVGANLRFADLRGANLRFADLADANLRGANLFRATLSDTDLRGLNRNTDLRATNLSSADLRFADLTGALHWTNEQLAQAQSMVGVILPDGTVMSQEGWEESQKLYR
jgi:hypothetical protein